MQRANLRTGLLAGVTVLALGGCSFFHHRDDRSDSASARPRMEQQGSSQQAAANNQPAQGAYGTGASAMPSGNDYAARGAANVDNRYTDRTSGSGYPGNAPRDGSTGASGSPYANGAAGAGSSGMSGSGSTAAPAQRSSPSAMSDATSPNGVQGDTPTAPRGAVAGAVPANGAQQGRGATNPTAAQGAEATGAPQPLLQNNTRNQMQNQLQNQTGLVDVNLNNVKVDVAKNLNIDASRIPVTVQLPVTAAADVCGVDVNALAAQKQQGGGMPSCTANNANEATQAVQTSVQ